MQTRGSDRSILLLHVVIRSYEVTWTLQLASGGRGCGSSSKTHAASPFQLNEKIRRLSREDFKCCGYQTRLTHELPR